MSLWCSVRNLIILVKLKLACHAFGRKSEVKGAELTKYRAKKFWNYSIYGILHSFCLDAKRIKKSRRTLGNCFAPFIPSIACVVHAPHFHASIQYFLGSLWKLWLETAYLFMIRSNWSLLTENWSLTTDNWQLIPIHPTLNTKTLFLNSWN